MVNKVKFERETVVRLASQLFWEKGFNATSTRDLQDAINMRPGSIYSAFGSKEGLYIESLKNYTMQIEDQIKTCLLASPTIIGGLQTFVENVIIKDKKNAPSAICMLVKANCEFADEDSCLYSLSLDLSDKFENYLSDLFAQAIAREELKGEVSPKDYARFFKVQFTGLRGYFNRPGVEEIAQPMIDQMFKIMKTL
ncbi:TetR/AcrR family transcriptional regulator [Pseudoalteromonas marina]|uniref:TetR/AcrR family transcriptional regulator n=1 Tax=Pseudoalteromonas marina TaxID=267375 RepID=UPI0023F169DE|nr:TetR/AcrR family transcriptional regulator [Pseudoalteromonas marina]